MIETLLMLSLSFWVAVLCLILGFAWALSRLREGTGLPVLAVLTTAAFWYIGDVLYNDYARNHAVLFTSEVLENAWWQVALFLLIFLLSVPFLHRKLNGKLLRQPSYTFELWEKGTDGDLFQSQISLLCKGCLVVWAILAGIATIRLQDEVIYYFFPFLAYKADPWGRGRVGEQFDWLISFASYFQIYVAGAFGLLTALSKNRKVFFLSLLGCFLTWPYYLFDRTRNTLLAVTLPAILSWVFLRFRGGIIAKLLVLAVCFVVVDSWLSFVIANRTNTSIAAAFQEKGYSLKKEEGAHHFGLNMFEELCWMNTFIDDGSYQPNWGERYFAELVNPIPRSLWSDKPFIGIDYAIARGQGGGTDDQGGVFATVSTGMIGQGVANFGRYLGPAFAGFLMACWVALLARLDLTGEQIGRIPLYIFGIILTFNLGRDITFITLYSIIFGRLLLWGIERINQKKIIDWLALKDTGRSSRNMSRSKFTQHR